MQSIKRNIKVERTAALETKENRLINQPGFYLIKRLELDRFYSMQKNYVFFLGLCFCACVCAQALCADVVVVSNFEWFKYLFLML